MANSEEFDGKVVLVTGSSSGIGEATVVRFAVAGAKVVVTGRNADKVRNVAQKCRSLAQSDNNVLEVTADLMVEEDIKRLIETTIKVYGKLDVLVNNAGIAANTAIEDDKVVNTYDNVMNTNARAVVLLCHYAVKHLSLTRGAIVSVSSVASTKPHNQFFAYCMAKCSVDMLTKCLAIDLGDRGIRVNAVNPAVTRTSIFSSCFGFDKRVTDSVVYKECEDNYPLKRPAEPEEVAEAIAFLAHSKKASFITGVTLTIDGGSMWTSRGAKVN